MARPAPEEPMQIENRVYPDAEQLAAMQQPGPDGPVVMVNLLKFRPRAQYRDGRETALSGREAYQLYAKAVVKLLEGVGGRVVFSGDATFLMLGRVEGLWDEVALAEYPSRSALLQMSMSPEWQAIAVHREAGLEGQLNIETVPTPVPR
jgi:uncharacterized protein (DUF1330 family)